jgi:uncharacterized CHY-type Zn-finger protein
MDVKPPRSEQTIGRTNLLLGGVSIAFIGLAALFVANLWGHPAPSRKIPLVDPALLEPTPWRRTYADLVKAKEDLSDYDCYGCHEKKNPPPIRYDANQKIIVPKEHSDIVMGHGSHDRNNLCYNCHNEQNLLTLQVRDGREVKFDNIPPLCGSCHGPTYRDWEAGAHGRTSGYWDRSKGEIQRLSCANCHNPHAPRIPTRQPAPGPHPLRAENLPAHEAAAIAAIPAPSP